MIPKIVRGLQFGAVVCTLAMPVVAGALGMSIVDVSSTGSSTSVLARGDVLTLDLVVSNPDEIETFGIGLVAYGYDVDQNTLADDGLELVSVVRAASLFNTVAAGAGSAGGLPLFEGYTGPRDTVAPFAPSPGAWSGRERVVRLFGSVSLSPSNGDGSLDIGVDGGRISEGDAHFRVSFRATSRLNATLMRLGFGIGSPTGTGSFSSYGEGVVGRGGVMQPFSDVYYEVTILSNPEPGTALLIGLGLGALAAIRPRAVAG